MLGWAAGPDAAGWAVDAPSVRIHSVVNQQPERLWVVQNWTGDAATVTLPFPATDLQMGEEPAAARVLELRSWDVSVVVTPA